MFTKRVSGFTLVEMVLAIVIIGIGLAGVLTAFSVTVKSSADPLIHKQMLAIAEEMLEEVLLKPYAVSGTAPANSLKACGGVTSPARSAFDDVFDYNGYATTGICDIDGAAVTGLGSFNVAVAVDDVNLGDAASGGAIAFTRRVRVTVTHGAESLALTGWRTDYAS